MRDARDAEDNRLLEAGEIDLLLAGWYGNCELLRLPSGQAELNCHYALI